MEKELYTWAVSNTHWPFSKYGVRLTVKWGQGEFLVCVFSVTECTGWYRNCWTARSWKHLSIQGPQKGGRLRGRYTGVLWRRLHPLCLRSLQLNFTFIYWHLMYSWCFGFLHFFQYTFISTFSKFLSVIFFKKDTCFFSRRHFGNIFHVWVCQKPNSSL